VRTWATVEDFQRYLGANRLFKIVLEESPPTTALAIILCFVGGVFGLGIVGVFFIISASALLGALFCSYTTTSLKPRVAFLMWLHGAIALTAMFGLFESILMAFLSVAAVIAACILVALLIVEFFVRCLAGRARSPGGGHDLFFKDACVTPDKLGERDVIAEFR
jgi:hypothetical protein